MNLKKKEKIIIYVVGGCISIFLIEKILFSPLRNKIINLHKQIKLEETGLKQSISIQKRKESILAQYNDYKKYFETVGLSDNEMVGKFLNELEKMAQETQLSIVGLNPQQEYKDKEQHRLYSAELRAEGSIEQALSFINRIQSSILLVKLDKLSLTPKDEQADILRIDMVVSVLVFK